MRGTRVLLAAGVLVAAGFAAAGQAAAAGPSPSPVLPHESPSATTGPLSSAPAAQEPPVRSVPPSVPASAGASQVERGRQLYGAGCAGCHGQTGEGSSQGPSLAGVGPADTDFQLSTGRMPLSRVVAQPGHNPPVYNRADIDALVAYVASLGPGGQPIPAVGAGNLQSGRELYLRNCASCHSSTGVGEALPAGYVAPSLLEDDAARVAEAIRVGPGIMPQFPRTALSDEQLNDIVTYVEALPPRENHGGWAIGNVGPVAEGFFGWVVGLGLLLVVIRLLGKRAPR